MIALFSRNRIASQS